MKFNTIRKFVLQYQLVGHTSQVRLEQQMRTTGICDEFITPRGDHVLFAGRPFFVAPK